MYKLRIAIMGLLCAGIAVGAVYFVHRHGQNENPEKERIEFLVRSLGDRNPDVRRKAEAELRQLGPKAAQPLRTAAQSTDPAVAERAKKLLAEIEGKSDSTAKGDRKDAEKKEEGRTPEPEPRGVSVEIVPSREKSRGALRFYVRITNHDAAPYLLARERADGRFYYGRFAKFEIVDARGRAFAIPAESPLASAKPEFVIIGSGETLDLFAGQDDSMTGVQASLDPGTYQVRFVYDASMKSAYRHAVLHSAGASPLPPQILASAQVRITLPN